MIYPKHVKIWKSEKSKPVHLQACGQDARAPHRPHINITWFLRSTAQCAPLHAAPATRSSGCRAPPPACHLAALEGSLLEIASCSEHEVRDREAAQAAVVEAGAQHVAARAGAISVGGGRQEREGGEARLRLRRTGEHELIRADMSTRVSLEKVQRRVSGGHLVRGLGGRRGLGVWGFGFGGLSSGSGSGGQ
eukprot:scaffold121005_cov48-Phaeocystis_antarctica.AAC.1